MSDSLPRLTAALADRYRIERELGTGGMATVYLAHDLKHDRDVAIKVLHPDLGAALGSERFLSEIKTTARLQHPHILPLLDSGDAGGLLYYVMPLAIGETLRARLEREHQLPIEDAVRIATEVADALAAAHALGIIHRDIKPENILLQGGHALVADFGIALAVQQAGGQRMTQTGLSLGTPQYMSPEQAMGERAVDARSDIYSLGAVTYEMLVGEPPFTGATVQTIVAKVMTERPSPPSAVRDTVPVSVERAVLKALAKLPADRFATADKFAEALTAPASTAGIPSPGTRRQAWWERHAMPIIASLGAMAVVAGILAVRKPRLSSTTDINRFAVELGSGETLSPGGGTRLAWGPDGRSFAYVGADAGGTSRIMVRSLDSLQATPITGTDGGSSAVFSPDGQNVGFLTTARFSLQIVPRTGGTPRVVLDDSISGGGIDWAADGYLYYDGATTISRIRPDGTGREALARLDTLRNEIGLAWPQALPGGKGVIFRVRRTGEEASQYTIDVVDLKSRARKQLVKAIFARYLPTGHLLYALSDGSLVASRFDLGRLELTGTPVLIARGLSLGAFGAADIALSTDGSLLYSTGGSLTTVEPVWVGRDGVASKVDPAWRDVFAAGIALSPDGSRLAMDLNAPSAGSTNRTEDIWVKQLPTGPLSRLTFEGEQNRRPSWSHDGRDLIFVSSRSGPAELFRQRADGSAAARQIAAYHGVIGEGFESPDGRWLVLRTEILSPGAGDIMVMQSGVDTAPRPLIATRFQELAPAISPDGHWLAYSSDETGRSEIYVRPFPDALSGKVQVSTAGGRVPRWSPKGDEVFYVGAGNDLMAARVRVTPTFAVLGQSRLFSTVGFLVGTEHASYDVTADGRRFIMLRPGTAGGTSDAPHLILVQNFLTYLKRVLP